MERKIRYNDKNLIALIEDKTARLKVLERYNKEILAQMDEREKLGFELDDVKIKIQDIVRELSKDDRKEFEVPQETTLVDGEVEVTFVDMLEGAKAKLRNAFVEAKNNRKKQDKKRKK